MSFSYNFGANPQIDGPRMLIADTDSTHAIFQDEEVLFAYTLDAYSFFPPVSQGVAGVVIGTPSARRAAAVLLDSLAANKARLAAALEVLDIKIDPSKAAVELRATAVMFRDVENQMGIIGIAEQYNTEFAGRDRIWKQLLRLFGGGAG